MKKIIIAAIAMAFISGCSSITDTVTGAIQRTVQDTIDKTVQGAENAAKDKLGDILGGSSSSVDASLNTPFRIKMQQTGYIKSEGLKAKFISISEESRCPSDVQCIQQGQVSALVNVTTNGTDLGNFTLIQRSGSNLNITRVGNYTFTLNSVEPASFLSGRTPQAADYYITLTVTR